MDKQRLTLVQTGAVGTYGYNLPLGWEAAIRGWLSWMKIGGCSAATMRLRRDHVRSVARRSKTPRPAAVTLGMLVELTSQRTYSKEHLRGMRTSLNSFFDWCVINGEALENPALNLPRVKASAPAPRPAPDEVWEELLAAADPRERLMARLAGEAGLRRAEVAQCRRDDLVRDLAGWSLIVHGKGSKQRVVPLTVSLARAIQDHCRTGYLFPGQINGHISAGWVGTVISRLMPEGYTMHKLRHRFATRGYAGTRDIRAVQQALGHASVATTERYTAVTARHVRAVSEAAGDGNDAA